MVSLRSIAAVLPLIFAVGCAPPALIVPEADQARAGYEIDRRQCVNWGYAVSGEMVDQPMAVLDRVFFNVAVTTGARVPEYSNPQLVEVASDASNYLMREVPFQRWSSTFAAWCLEERGYTVVNRMELRLSPVEDFCALLDEHLGLGKAGLRKCIESVRERNARIGLVD